LDGLDEWGSLREGILARLTPGEDERRLVEGFCDRTVGELSERLKEAGLRGRAELHGSVARDTWIAGERDLDIFIVLDAEEGRKAIPRALEVVKEYLRGGWKEAYAEHPYIQAEVGGFRIDVVPCFRVDPRRGLLSSTDRTPLHTEFVKERLSPEERNEVRLLKRFMAGVDIYGAEIRVGGFSGYLCELLVINYGSFEGTLGRASGWRRGEVIDLAGKADVRALRKRFRDPLIIIDPVDPSRNAASAVTDSSMWTFVAAARAFLENPREGFFFPEEKVVEASSLLKSIAERGSDLLFVVVEDGEVSVPDVLWGQLYKTERALSSLLLKNGFPLMRSGTWSDEEERHVFVFELEAAEVPPVTIRNGPPVMMGEDSGKFLDAHLGAGATVSGPGIRGSRWWVETRRQHTDAVGLLDEALSDGGRGVGVSRGIAEKLEGNRRVLLNGEIAEFLEGELLGFLDGFLRGRPDWLG